MPIRQEFLNWVNVRILLCLRRLERVLTCDPGSGIARHADAGYDLAIETAKEKGVKIPGLRQG